MGVLTLEEIEFSEQVQAEWSDPEMYRKLKQGEPFLNPKVELQVQIS
jgi:6-pyruvoyltetrahydropterin/6-carboxytetrahydropterin synthase